MIRAVLFDLDGVIRHFDHDPALEGRHGLEDAALAQAAFGAPLIEEVTTGRITRAEWIRRVGEQTGAPAAAEEWGRTPFRVDPAMTTLADELRALGVTCAILTNGTDTIAEEAEACGLTDHFDPIFNSADIGHTKPDPRAFAHVAQVLRIPTDEIFFTDDSPAKLAGADEFGMRTHHFTGVRSLRSALRDAGLPVAPASETHPSQ